MDAAFLRAAFPREYYALGCRLLPFTFGHWFLLNEYVPFFTDREVTRYSPDLETAVFICSRPHAEAGIALKRRWLPFIFWLWGIRTRKANKEGAFESFCEYLRENQRGPLVNTPDKIRRKECGGPWVWRLYSQMLSTFHMSESQAMGFPVLRALCLEAAHNEHHGHVELAHPNIRMLIDRFRERKAAHGAA